MNEIKHPIHLFDVDCGECRVFGIIFMLVTMGLGFVIGMMVYR